MVTRAKRPALPKIGARVRVHWTGTSTVVGQVLDVDDVPADPLVVVAIYLDDAETDYFTLARSLSDIEGLDAA